MLGEPMIRPGELKPADKAARSAVETIAARIIEQSIMLTWSETYIDWLRELVDGATSECPVSERIEYVDADGQTRDKVIGWRDILDGAGSTWQPWLSDRCGTFAEAERIPGQTELMRMFAEEAMEIAVVADCLRRSRVRQDVAALRDLSDSVARYPHEARVVWARYSNELVPVRPGNNEEQA